MPAKGKRKNNPGKADKLCPPLKTRQQVTGHPPPPTLTPPLPPQVTDNEGDDEATDDQLILDYENPEHMNAAFVEIATKSNTFSRAVSPHF